MRCSICRKNGVEAFRSQTVNPACLHWLQGIRRTSLVTLLRDISMLRGTRPRH